MHKPPHFARRRFLRNSALAAIAYSVAGRAGAQAEYPTQPVRLIVPFSPGGAVDIYSRIISPELSKRLGQTVVVENRPGASGNIGAELVKRAAPDGHTLLVGNIAIMGINPVVYKNNPIDPLKDLTPITKTVNVNYVLVLNPQVPARSAAELIAYAKANPGKLTYGSSGTGSMQQMAAELFQARTGIKLLHVPYKGTGALVGDLVAGHVDMIFADEGSMMQQVNAGKLVALGVCGLARRPQYPDLPTIAEAANLPGFEAVAWQGLAGPANLPAPIVEKLNTAFNAIQADPQIKARLAEAGLSTDAGTPQAFAQYIGAELEKWRKVATDIGISVE
ncbi:Bug family tripartite tricarboxylate transporter substrate binding protein [Bordetella petrii]|uniref:Bug family tripartite tricarboxylate transporter substrate binding protein n=1 Tax=Bordetella petrii TaxID=94624 RepID=UPI001E56092E|nr:tripartite tricarboxylate transporter substrate binding protein [Bordetella petrii]MCD0503783.1 tripartite tricarboxylate transporter substrate binding protein [Bordetella petrii]